ncbi:MAG: rhomboid family intramembrane serine protease [Acidimicrobiales bacterium]
MPEPFRPCYRHPNQMAGVICQRCDRPICTQCMHQAAVGFHCPECAKAGRQRVYTAQTLQRMNQPIAALVLIAINSAVWLAGFAIPGAQNAMQADYSLVVQALYHGHVIGVGEGQWWRIITAGFLHLSWIHIISNMVALWIFGILCERLVGSWRFVVVYAVSLLAGSFGALIADPHVSSAGASGAIFGLYGLLFVGARARGLDLRGTGLTTLLVINLVITFTIPGISVGAHIGGLLAGFVASWALLELPKLLPASSAKVRSGIAIGSTVVIGIGCFVGALLIASANTIPV